MNPDNYKYKDLYKNYEPDFKDYYNQMNAVTYGYCEDTKPMKYSVRYYRGTSLREKLFSTYSDAVLKMTQFLSRGICATVKSL